MEQYLRVIVLGAAAGGGLPQWNCGCPNCVDARAGAIPRLTQSSVIVSADGKNWVLLNASPDIRSQCENQPALYPTGIRGTPISSVVLTNGDIDHIAGLLVLREKTGFDIFATREILSIFEQDSVFSVLDPELVRSNRMEIGQEFTPAPDLKMTAFTVPGKVPLFQESGDVDTMMISENTIGLRISAHGKTLCYVPGCAQIRPDFLDRLKDTDLLLFDGTVWQNEEMIETGTGTKTAARMGHVSIKGEGGSLLAFAGLPDLRRAYIHINNTNPILQPGSDQRQEVEAAGWTVTQDGMEFRL